MSVPLGSLPPTQPGSTNPPPPRRVPGSGKSTLAYPLVDEINRLLGCGPAEPAEVDGALATVRGEDSVGKGEGRGREGRRAVAVAVGLDGWHYTRAELDGFPVSTLNMRE